MEFLKVGVEESEAVLLLLRPRKLGHSLQGTERVVGLGTRVEE